MLNIVIYVFSLFNTGSLIHIEHFLRYAKTMDIYIRVDINRYYTNVNNFQISYYYNIIHIRIIFVKKKLIDCEFVI